MAMTNLVEHMMTHSRSLLTVAGLLAAVACAPKSEAPPPAESEAAAPAVVAEVPQAWFGEYADPEYPDKGWWRKLTLAPGATPAEAAVSFTSTSTRRGSTDPDCSYQGTGSWVEGHLEAPIEWKAADGVAVTMTIMVTDSGTAVVSATGGSDPVLGLGWYCRGGASLAGEYRRVP
jgi:hypothetical protein